MRRAAFIISLLSAAFLGLLGGHQVMAQGFSAIARLDTQNSQITTARGALRIDLALSQGVPFRAYTLDEPARLVLDFREVSFDRVEAKQIFPAGEGRALRFGRVRPGWSRLVLDLPTPQVVDTASMRVEPETGTAQLIVSMRPSVKEAFALQAGAPADPDWDRLMSAASASIAPKDKAKTVVVLDPGHGGIDPGAAGKGISEAELMLVLAREIEESLLRSGEISVVLTRQGDEFVSLERRVQIAREAGADLFVSLHADALASGQANGAAVYTLSEEASDKASAALAERHNRADLLAGVDLSGQDDQVAAILMQLARLDNRPRSQALARGIILGINTEVGHTYKRPIQAAGFSVLKAADIPSVLVEVGFLSSKDDLSKLTDPKWRSKMVRGIHNGIQAWLLTDAADAQLRRK